MFVNTRDRCYVDAGTQCVDGLVECNLLLRPAIDNENTPSRRVQRGYAPLDEHDRRAGQEFSEWRKAWHNIANDALLQSYAFQEALALADQDDAAAAARSASQPRRGHQSGIAGPQHGDITTGAADDL